jgi:hypothetical protein
MIDVRKLVTGFLVLAVAASASALLITSFGFGKNNGQGQNPGTNSAVSISTSGSQSQSTGLTGNAFAAQNLVNNNLADAAANVDPNDESNLTNLFADTYLTNLVSANPNGLQNSAGNLTPPDASSVIAQFESYNTSSTLNLPTQSWDFEAAKIAINPEANTSPTAMTNYSAALGNIFNQDFVQTNIQAMVTNNSDPSDAGYVSNEIDSALKDIAGLQTPQSAVEFQKSLLKMLVYEKNILGLLNTTSSDPMKMALTIQGENAPYNTVTQNFSEQLKKISGVNGFSLAIPSATPVAPKGFVGFIDNVLGIKPAYAIFGLGDIVFDPANLAQLVEQYALNVALQIVKNFIMSEMQKTVLKWVQGNGVPKFIQNWSETLVNAYTQSAISALNSQMQCINMAPFAGQIKLTIGATYPPNSATNVCAVQFQAGLANNLNNFYNNFSNGGWVTFGETLLPDNNYYGALFFTAQAVGNAAQTGQTVAQTQAIANQGWIGKSVCVGSSGNGVDPTTGCKPGDILAASGQCFSSITKTNYAPANVQGGACPDGSSPQVLQPGQVTGQVFNSAVDSSGQLTAAANDVAGILDAFTSSLLNSLASDAITTAGGALNNLGNGGGGGGGGANAANPSSQNGQVPITCTETQAPGSNSFSFFAGGGQTISGSGAAVNITTPQYSWLVTSQTTGATVASGNGSLFQTNLNTGSYDVVVTDTVDATSKDCGIVTAQ